MSGFFRWVWTVFDPQFVFAIHLWRDIFAPIPPSAFRIASLHGRVSRLSTAASFPSTCPTGSFHINSPRPEAQYALYVANEYEAG